jgi:hypothetical protein
MTQDTLFSSRLIFLAPTYSLQVLLTVQTNCLPQAWVTFVPLVLQKQGQGSRVMNSSIQTAKASSPTSPSDFGDNSQPKYQGAYPLTRCSPHKLYNSVPRLTPTSYHE